MFALEPPSAIVIPPAGTGPVSVKLATTCNPPEDEIVGGWSVDETDETATPVGESTMIFTVAVVPPALAVIVTSTGAVTLEVVTANV